MAQHHRTRELAARYGRLMLENGIKHYHKLDVDYYTGYFSSLYDWEMYFDGIALAYYGLTEPTVNGIRMFLDLQRKDGFIRRCLHPKMAYPSTDAWRRMMEYEAEEHCKPFLMQSAMVVSRARGNSLWLMPPEFRKLERYIEHWLTAWDRDGNGLSEWASGPHSGADTQLTRIGPWESRYCEGADLNAYLCVECRAAAHLARALGDTLAAGRWDREAERKADRVRGVLWDKQEGMFLDRDARTGERIRVRSAATFLPLWAGIATPEQARILVERHLTNPDEFWTPYPVASYARTEPNYTQFYDPGPNADIVLQLTHGHSNWCGGSWPHWNYLILHGLHDYGFRDEARHIAGRWAEMASSPNGLYEWYDAETGEGEGLNPFYAGASVLGLFAAPELAHDFNPTRPKTVDDRLDFGPIRAELGIEQAK